MKTKERGIYVDVNHRVMNNDASMYNGLMSSQELKMYDHCKGIHGAMKERRGAKKATSAARRRYEKQLISDALNETD